MNIIRILLTTICISLLSSSPAFAKEYNKLDSSDKNKTEKFVKVDKTDSSDTTTSFGGSGGTPDILSIDFSSNFSSGQYILTDTEKQQIKDKLVKVNDFIKNTGKNSFLLTINSSESQVPSKFAEGELAKLRAAEVQKVISEFLLTNTSAVFKIVIKDQVGSTKFDRSEANKIGMKKAVNLKKYTDEQSVGIQLSTADFDTPCSWNLKSPKGTTLTSSTDYSITTTFDVTDQVGAGDLVLSPGGIPDRAELWIDGQLVGDTGYFVNNMTSQDRNSKYFTYIPRYVAELTKVSNEKGMFAVKDSSEKQLITKTFTTFEELVDFMLTPEAKKNGYDVFKSGLDTGDYMEVLKDMWGRPGYRGVRTFTFYDKDPYEKGTQVKLKFKLNGHNKRVDVRIFSPLGKTDYSCVGHCAQPKP
jgi:mRNA-degrading endonuclease RelE of RelBE toxin-antitoxin system